MKAVIVTQEEPFYIPLFLGKVLAEYERVHGIIVLPWTLKGFNLFSYIKRLYDVFGLKDFIAYGVLFIYYRLLDQMSRWKQFGRYYSVKSAARSNSIPLYQLKNINSPESLNCLKALEPEVIISVASSQKFKEKAINSAKHTINIHAALLPQYQGMMPSFWVCAKGEGKTGVTVHYMNECIDKGNIILQETIDISRYDTLHSLQTKVANVGGVTLLNALKKIENDDGTGIPPQGEGSYYSFPTKEAAREFRDRGRKFI